MILNKFLHYELMRSNILMLAREKICLSSSSDHEMCYRFHLYIIGSEECERSIAQSAVNTSKKAWEAFLSEVVGPMYVPLRSHTLQVS